MTDMMAALSDPELGLLSFTVRIPTYTFSQGAAAVAWTDRHAEGCIQPGAPEMTQLLPAEERHRELIVIYTSFPLSLGRNTGGAAWTAADRILYNDRVWKLVRLRDWFRFGYYQGLAVLTDET